MTTHPTPLGPPFSTATPPDLPRSLSELFFKSGFWLGAGVQKFIANFFLKPVFGQMCGEPLFVLGEVDAHDFAHSWVEMLFSEGAGRLGRLVHTTVLLLVPWAVGVPGTVDVAERTRLSNSSFVISPLYQRGRWPDIAADIQTIWSSVVARLAPLTAHETASAATLSAGFTSSPNSIWHSSSSSKASRYFALCCVSSPIALIAFSSLRMTLRISSRRTSSRSASSRSRAFRRLKFSLMSVVTVVAATPTTTPIRPIQEASMPSTVRAVCAL